MTEYIGPVEKITDWSWRLPRAYKHGMHVDGIIYATAAQMEMILRDKAVEQVANVAMLPGIQKASLAMPDIHWGYGFCIGGVAATDPAAGGVISPGGVGYDINCGVRLVRTNLQYEDVQPRLEKIVTELFHRIPTGAGQTGHFKFDRKQLKRLMADGPKCLIERGWATPRDIQFTEAHGQLEGAEPDLVSDRAIERGLEQCGTLGGGNHFLEVQVVQQVHDAVAAEVMGLREGQVCVMIHSGSRGLGYQVCDDALMHLRGAPERYGIMLPDRQLACAPVDAPEGRKYLGTMRAAANFAWCNRQLLMHQARTVFERVLGKKWQQLGMEQVYDVAHNIAKLEEHGVTGVRKKVWVHRKGATRAFPAGHPELPEEYQSIGQPVMIPGDMGRASWVLVGQAGSMEQSFGSTCHGAGRAMSRTQAVRAAGNRSIEKELGQRGVVAKARSWKGLAEEQPDAYKDVDVVVETVHHAGLSRKVARMRPIGVIKG